LLADQFVREVKARRNLLVKEFLRENVLTMTAAGGSMAPTIEDGSEVHIQSSNSYRIGEIVLYESKFRDLTLHRIVDIGSSDSYFLKGDSEDYIEMVSRASIYGKMISTPPERPISCRLVSDEVTGYHVCVVVHIVDSRLSAISLEEKVAI